MRKKRLSENTLKLVERLHRPRSFIASLTADPNEKRILEEIGNSGEPAAIPFLVSFAIASKSEVAEASARAIERLLAALTPADYVQFDQYVRLGYANMLSRWKRWDEFRERDLRRMMKFGDAGVAVMGLASCHWNGHVREGAVRELGKVRTGAELPFLLMRVNDWVTPVRYLARLLLGERVRVEYGAHFLKWLPLVVRLRTMSRWNQADLVEAIQRMIESAEAVAFLRPGCESTDRTVRSFCFQELLTREEERSESLVRRALADREPLIRLEGVKALGKVSDRARQLELLRQAKRDRFSKVRAEAMAVYSEHFPEEEEGVVNEGLLDANIIVRELAQFLHEKRGGPNLREFYRERLKIARGEKLCGAIAGLGEKGNAGDSNLIEGYLKHGIPRVRAAALRAVAKLDFNRHIDELVEGLTDQSRSVAREARAALMRKANSAGGERLWRTFSSCGNARGKRGILFLIARLTRWESLGYLLQALGDADESISAASGRYIRRLSQRWNRSFTKPTAEQVAWLNGILDTHGLLLSETELQSYRKLLNV